MQGGDGADVGLTRRHEGRINHLEPFHAVLDAALVELAECGCFAGFESHDELAAARMGDGMPRAEFVEQMSPLNDKRALSVRGG